MRQLRIACRYSSCVRRILLHEYNLTGRRTILFCAQTTKSSHNYFSTTAARNATAANPLSVVTTSQTASNAIGGSAAADPSLVTELSSVVVDPPFTELGLASGWWPYQIVQGWLEAVHIASGLPWWVTVAAGTLILRVVTFPLFAASRKSMIRYTNHMPDIMELQKKRREAFASGDYAKKLSSQQKLHEFNKKNKTGSFLLLLNNLPQPILFISCMMALRQMCSVPVPSMEASEFLWVTSFSGPDPYRLLPAIAGGVISLNLLVAVRLKTTANAAAMQKSIKYLAVLPPLLMPLVVGSWPCAIALYITVNSMTTVAVTALLSNETITRKLNIPAVVVREAGESSPVKSMLKDSIKDSREKAMLKMESRDIRITLKEKKKARKKALKKPPPAFYEIGTEAIAKNDIPDFKQDWRPPRVNIYQQ